jgi:hypothetical protein
MTGTFQAQPQEIGFSSTSLHKPATTKLCCFEQAKESGIS